MKSLPFPIRHIVLYILLLTTYLVSACEAQTIPQPDTIYTDSTGVLVSDGQYWYEGGIQRTPYINNELVLFFTEMATQAQKDSLIQEFDLIEIRPELSHSDPYILCTQDNLAVLIAQSLRKSSLVEYVYPLNGRHGRRRSSGHSHYTTNMSIRVQTKWDSLQISNFETEYGLSFIKFSSGLSTYEVKLTPPTHRHILETISQINLDKRVIRAYPSSGGSPNRIGVPADFNFDGTVDLKDLNIFVGYYGREFQCRTEGINCDLNFDYKVDFRDFLKFAYEYRISH